MAVVHTRATDVLKLPREHREANLNAYTAELLRMAPVEDHQQAKQLAAAINAMTLELVAKIENSSGAMPREYSARRVSKARR